MDKLYYYVLRADESLKKSKDMLDVAEQEFSRQYSANKKDVESKLINYFLYSSMSTTGANDLKLNTVSNKDDSSDDDSIPENQHIGELSDDDDDSEDLLTENSTIGDKVIALWNKRKPKLCHDVAIAGWLTSPDPEIRKTIDGRKKEHLQAVERLFQKWFKHKVSLLTTLLYLFHN